MARKIVDETLKFTVVINGDSAKKEFGQLERSQKKLLNANKDLEEQAKKLEKANKANTEEYRQLKAQMAENTKAYQTNEKRLQELTKEIGINNLSMRQLGREARKLNGIMANLDPNTEEWAEYNKQLLAVKARMAEIKEKMRPVSEAMEEQLSTLEQFGGGVVQFLSALRSGNIKEAVAGLEAVKGGIQGATKAAWAFIATPLGAALTAIVGVVGAVKFWADYNESLREAILLTEQITGLQGEEANTIRRQAKVLEEVYGANFEETLGTANGLVRDFKISFGEALNEIEEGLKRGQNLNGEYFDSLGEYDTFFAQAGFSAKEFRKVIQTGWDLGVYTDKLPDAIKEADLSLREQGTATRDALVNTFGAAFTDDILGRIKRGEITTKQALEEISAKAVEMGVNVQQNAQLTADVFRGAGEDVGGAIKIFEALNIAINEQERALTPLEEMINEVATANKELAQAQEEALKSDSYLALSNDIELFWTKTKTAFFKGIRFITDKFSQASEWMVGFWAKNIITIKIFPKVVRQSLSRVKDEVFDVLKTFKGLGDVIENLLSFNFDVARDSFRSFKEDFKKEVGDVVDVGADAVSMLNQARQKVGDQVADHFQRRRQAAREQGAQGAASGSPVVPLNPENGNGSGGDSGPSPEEEKRLAQIKRNEEQITAFIKAEREKRAIEAKAGLEKELALIDQKYAAQIQKAGENDELTKQLIELREGEKNDIRVQKALELQQRLKELDDDNFLTQEEIRLEREAMAAETQAEKDRINLEREQLLAQSKLDAELALAEERLRVNNATEEEIFAVRKKFALQQEKLDLKFSAARSKIDAKEKDEKKEKFRAEVSEAADATGQLADLLGRQTTAGKAASIAQATMNTYQGVTQVWKADSVLPEPAATIAKVISTATVLASGLAAVANIKKTDASVQGFQHGLYPVRRSQDGRIFQTQYGGEPSTQIVSAPTRFIAGEVQPEMIIDGDTFKKLDPAITNYILGLAGKAVPGYQGGKYPDDPAQTVGVEMLVPLLTSLNEKLDAPLVAEVLYGPEASIKQQEYDKRVRQTRQNAKIKK
ncbi:MAG: hypothetical protein AB3N16_15115 [Flavobacteriaceae bacterium]